jgi:outer membrane lipoprotein-sorting protein
MMLRFKALALAAAPLAAAAILVPQAPVAAQAGSPLSQVTAHLRAVNTMVAGFRQTDRKGRALTGTMTLKRPGKLRFQYQKGVPMLIVADGRKLNMIDYETGRVDGWPIGNSPLGVLLNPNPDLSRIAKVVRNDAQTLLVQARDPKKPEFGTITLGFAKVSSGPAGLLLQGWTVIDAQNNRTTVKLSGQRFNVPVADSAFTFQRPVKGRKG